MTTRRIPWLLGIVLLAGCEGFVAEDGQTGDKFAPELAIALAQGFPVDVIVAFDDGSLVKNPELANRNATLRTTALGHLRTDLASLKQNTLGQLAGDQPLVIEDFPHLPSMHLRLANPGMLYALSALTNVQYIFGDAVMHTFAPSDNNLTLIKQNIADSSGFQGQGTAVAVIDTGLDYTRAPFNCIAPGSPAECPVAAVVDIATDDGQLDQGPLHGTNVAGIVLSVAPQTKLIGLDVFEQSGALTSTILKGLDWVLAHQADYNIVAVNLSLGGGLFSSACAVTPFEPALVQLRAAGILPVVASGNEASKKSIASPACSPSAISVGAVYPPNVPAIRTGICSDTTAPADKVACFSNSASMLTMLAPGVAITASGLTMSGTSQAAPHVAGAIAVLAGAFPNDTLAIRTTRLLMTKTTVTDTRNNLKKPRLDLQYAIGIGEGEPAPLGTMTINDGETYTTETSVTMDVTATIGKPDTMCVSLTSTCKNWIPYAPTTTVTLPTGDGTKTVFVKWKSAAGKISSTVSSKIILDTLPPSMGSIAGTATKGVITWRWSGNKDAGVGIASYTLVGNLVAAPADCDSGTLLYTGTLSTFKTDVLAKGTTQYVRVCAVDKAGHQSKGVTAKVLIK